MKNYLPNPKFKILKYFLILFLLFFTSCILRPALNKASAQETFTGISVAPARQEKTVDPGEKVPFIVKFLNGSDTPVSGVLGVADFIVDNNKGTPVFLEKEEAPSPKFAAAAWVKLPYNTIAIAANDKVSVQSTITVPKDALPGGRYFAIYLDLGKESPKFEDVQKAETGVGSRLAALVYLRVSGPVEENASLIRFTTPSFLEYGPIAVEAEILNLGNYHIKPQGVITLTDMFGQIKDKVMLDETNIFPDASRVYKSEIGKKWMLGKYTLNLTAPYGESGKAVTGTASVWLFPWRVIVAVILGVIIVISLVYIFWNKLKKKEKELEHKLEEEISDIETLKNKYKDAVTKTTAKEE